MVFIDLLRYVIPEFAKPFWQHLQAHGSFFKTPIASKKNAAAHLIAPKFIQTFLDGGHQPEESHREIRALIHCLLWVKGGRGKTGWLTGHGHSLCHTMSMSKSKFVGDSDKNISKNFIIFLKCIWGLLMFRNQTGKKKHVGQTSRAYPHGLCWDTPACSSWASFCEYAAPRCATWLAPTRPHDKLCARSGKKKTQPHMSFDTERFSHLSSNLVTQLFFAFSSICFIFGMFVIFASSFPWNTSSKRPSSNTTCVKTCSVCSQAWARPAVSCSIMG